LPENSGNTPTALSGRRGARFEAATRQHFEMGKLRALPQECGLQPRPARWLLPARPWSDPNRSSARLAEPLGANGSL
jgi:hypothetical protein